MRYEILQVFSCNKFVLSSSLYYTPLDLPRFNAPRPHGCQPLKESSSLHFA